MLALDIVDGFVLVFRIFSQGVKFCLLYSYELCPVFWIDLSYFFLFSLKENKIWASTVALCIKSISNESVYAAYNKQKDLMLNLQYFVTRITQWAAKTWLFPWLYSILSKVFKDDVLIRRSMYVHICHWFEKYEVCFCE